MGVGFFSEMDSSKNVFREEGVISRLGTNKGIND
jgi:hypothetical protein